MPLEFILLFEHPLILGVGLLAFGVLWLLGAAGLSLLWPSASARRASPSSPDPLLPSVKPLPPLPPGEKPLSLLRRRADGLFQDLFKRVESLEQSPSLSADAPVAFFDRRLQGLKGDMEDLRRALGRSVLWDSAATQLGGRVEKLSQAADAVLRTLTPEAPEDRPAAAVPVVPPPAPKSPEPAVAPAVPAQAPARSGAEAVAPPVPPLAALPPDPAPGVMEQARREREDFLRQREALKDQAAEKDRESRTAQTLQQAIADVAAQAEKAAAERRDLDQAFESLARERQSMEEERAALPPLQWRESQNAAAAADVERHRAALEREQARRQQRLERRRSRLERWRQGWKVHLIEQRRSLEKELAELRRRNQDLQSLRDKAAAESEAGLKALSLAREKLQRDREKFEREVAAPWQQERARWEERRVSLEETGTGLEKELRALQERRVQEEARFQEDAAAEKRAVREQGVRWREELAALRADFSQQIARASEEAAQARLSLETEQAAWKKTEQERRAALERDLAAAEAEKGDFQRRSAAEQVQWAQTLSQAAAQAAELHQAREALRAAVEQDLAHYARRRAELRAWAEGRFRTLETFLERTRQDQAGKLEVLQREKAGVQAALRSERERFRREGEALESAFNAKRAELETLRTSAEKDHAAFLERSRQEERDRQAELEKLRASVASLEKELAALRAGNERRLKRHQERFERALLNLQQKADQQKVSGEARLAQDKMALESLNRRVAARQARLDKALQRRREQIQQLLEEAHGTLELVRQGHWRENHAWSERLADLRRQEEAAGRQEAFLREGPQMAAQELRDEEKDLARRAEEEKTRLLKAAEDYWKSFLEKSADNEAALRKAHACLQSLESDLDRQEAAAHEFLAGAKNLVALLQDLRRKFKPRDGEARQSFSNPSVA